MITAGFSPMAGYSDLPFRNICSSLGAAFTVTEMVSAVAVSYRDPKSLKIAEITDDRSAIQIFGHDPLCMAESAAAVIEYNKDHRPVAVEINMGCPVKKIVTSGDGSALMKNVPLAADICSAVSEALKPYDIPLWVKIRAGWDKDSINAPEMAYELASRGASRITVHGRTRADMYSGKSDVNVIKQVREKVRGAEIFANGDICSLGDAISVLEYTGADGVTIGRHACGYPWIFREIDEYNRTGRTVFEKPSLKEVKDMSERVAKDLAAYYGEETGVKMSRSRIIHFFRGYRGSSEFRSGINRICTLDELTEHIRNFRGGLR